MPSVVRKEIPLPEVTLSRSAPTSPAMRSSIPRNLGQRRPPAAAYICVEKGRIEFARPEPATEECPVLRADDKSEEDKSKPALMMGSKIFRPQLRKPEASCIKTNTEDSSGKHLSPLKHSAAQTQKVREIRSPPQEPPKALGSTRKNYSLNRSFEKNPAPSSLETQQQIMSQSASAKDPKPSRIAKSISQGSREALSRKSREPSPAKQEPRSRSSIPAPVALSSLPKEPPRTSRGIPVPSSPNLIRWKAKLSKSSASNQSEKAAEGTVGDSAKDFEPVKVSTAAVNCEQPKGVTVESSSSPTSGSSDSSDSSGSKDSGSNCGSSDNQVQLSNLHFEVKRLEETVKSLLPLRNQQSALVQSYEQRLGEAQGRIVSLESENQMLKARLTKQETDGLEENKTVQKLQSENSTLLSQMEQQRVQFDKCMDDIANHVVQALISQKNLQAECRRLRSQVSDLEQQNVALNFLLTQSLRGSAGLMMESKLEIPTNPPLESLVQKSTSCDANISASAATCRDSTCTVASDSEVRLAKSNSMLDTTNRPIVSKDSNWSFGVFQDRSSVYNSPAVSPRSPIDRAEKLLAVLKHRLFSAQLPNHRSRRSENRRSLPAAALVDPLPLPERPSTLTLTSSTEAAGKSSSLVSEASPRENPTSPSVKALVRVLEKRCVGPTLKNPVNATSPEKVQNSASLPPTPRVGVTSNETDSPVSKDEGYSTMSSDVQVDSASSMSSFIASGSACSSPATLRRTGGSCSGHPTTRSLPINKRKTLSIDPSRQQPNRSISLQETHSGAALEDVKEVIDETDESGKSNFYHEDVSTDSNVAQETVDDSGREPPSNNVHSQQPSEPLRFKKLPLLQFSWPEPQLSSTLYDDWSPSSAGTLAHFETNDDSAVVKRARRKDAGDSQRWSCDSESLALQSKLHKWTSDSELYRSHQEIAANWMHTLQLQSHMAKSAAVTATSAETHPLRRTKARSRLGSAEESREHSPNEFELNPAEETTGRGYSTQEMEDWILRSSSEELIHRSFMRTGQGEEEAEEETEKYGAAVSLPSIKETSFELDDENMFSTRCNSSSSSKSNTRDCSPASSKSSSKEDLLSLETDFTRDFYRLVKFESNRSLANSEKYDHCVEEAVDSSAPDRQTALKSVLEFIAEQQKYCQQQESADQREGRSLTPDLPHPSELSHPPEASGLPTIHDLRRLLAADVDDSSLADESDLDDELDRDEEGLSTSWIPVRCSNLDDEISDPKTRASLFGSLLVSSSSSCCTTPDSPYACQPSTSLSTFHLAEEDEDEDETSRGIMREEITML